MVGSSAVVMATGHRPVVGGRQLTLIAQSVVVRELPVVFGLHDRGLGAHGVLADRDSADRADGSAVVRVPVRKQHSAQEGHRRQAGEAERGIHEDRAPGVHLASAAARGLRGWGPESHLGVLVLAGPGKARRG